VTAHHSQTRESTLLGSNFKGPVVFSIPSIIGIGIDSFASTLGLSSRCSRRHATTQAFHFCRNTQTHSDTSSPPVLVNLVNLVKLVQTCCQLLVFLVKPDHLNIIETLYTCNSTCLRAGSFVDSTQSWMNQGASDSTKLTKQQTAKAPDHATTVPCVSEKIPTSIQNIPE
jgi:hypothetical protein